MMRPNLAARPCDAVLLQAVLYNRIRPAPCTIEAHVPTTLMANPRYRYSGRASTPASSANADFRTLRQIETARPSTTRTTQGCATSSSGIMSSNPPPNSSEFDRSTKTLQLNTSTTSRNRCASPVHTLSTSACDLTTSLSSGTKPQCSVMFSVPNRLAVS